jgi:uncharacterized protein (DUF433 family)
MRKAEQVIMAIPLITKSKEIMGGTPVFYGTRVPVQTLIDYLAAGETIEEFLDDFPTVSQEQAVRFLETAGANLISQTNESSD